MTYYNNILLIIIKYYKLHNISVSFSNPDRLTNIKLVPVRVTVERPDPKGLFTFC